MTKLRANAGNDSFVISLITVELWTLSTCLIQNFSVSLLHRRRNTVSLEINLSLVKNILFEFPPTEFGRNYSFDSAIVLI